MAGYPLVDAKVNGTALHFVADSGAFFSLIFSGRGGATASEHHGGRRSA